MSYKHRTYFNQRAGSWRNRPLPAAFLQCLSRFDIRPHDIVLDVGCGAGCAARQIAEDQSDALIIAIDISDKMLACARKNLEPHPVRVLCHDACNLGLRSNSVHKIICYSTFPHFKNHKVALSEFYRVLAESGKVLIYHNCCSRRLNDYHAKIKDIVAFDKLPKAEQLAAMMRGVGFVGVKAEESSDMYYLEGMKGFGVNDLLKDAILDSLKNPVLFCDLDHIVRYMNKAAIEHYREGDKLIGQSVLACHNEKSQQQMRRIVEEMRAGLQEQLITDNEKYRIYMRAVRNPDGELLGYYERYDPPRGA